MVDQIISAEGVTKSFGDVHALKGVDLQVDTGTVFGLLGPNGAGKTTMVRILTTLLLPDRGQVPRSTGSTCVRDAEELRFRIGLAGQSAAVDENLTGLENLELVGRLYHLAKEESTRAVRRGTGALRPRRCRRPPRQDLLGRDAAPPGPGRQPRRAPRRPVPGRAHHRARPPQPDPTSGSSSGNCRTKARRCCSPPSTSRRPTSSPTRSRSSTSAP